MTTKDNRDSVGSEQESNLKNPDRRRVFGATAVAAAVGTVAQAGSSALAQVNVTTPPSNPSTTPPMIPPLPAGGPGKKIDQLKQVMQLVRAGIAATDIDGQKTTLNLGQYTKSWRIRPTTPTSDPGNSTCACGCS